MKKFIACFHTLQRINGIIVGLTLLSIICVVFLQTFTRYVVFYSLPWSEELSRFLFVTMIVLGINLAVTQNLFVKIDIIDNYLKGMTKKVVEVVRQGLALFVSMMLLFSSYQLILIGSYQVSAAMRLPMRYLYGVILVGFLLTVLSQLIRIYQTFSETEKEGQ